MHPNKSTKTDETKTIKFNYYDKNHERKSYLQKQIFPDKLGIKMYHFKINKSVETKKAIEIFECKRTNQKTMARRKNLKKIKRKRNVGK